MLLSLSNTQPGTAPVNELLVRNLNQKKKKNHILLSVIQEAKEMRIKEYSLLKISFS